MQSEYNRTVFVDLDGVLADFDGYFRTIMGIDPNRLKKPNGESSDEFWAKINAYGRDKFFTELPWIPGSKNIWDYVIDNFLNVKILSALGRQDKQDGLTTKGKTAWLNKHLPSLREDDIVLVSNKHAKKHYAKPGDILIDDTSSNIDEWSRKGGIGILFKTPTQVISTLRQYA